MFRPIESNLFAPSNTNTWTSDALGQRRSRRMILFWTIAVCAAVAGGAALTLITNEPDDCGAFTIGKSAIGGCDRIGR